MPSWKDYERFLKHDAWIYDPGNSGTDRAYWKRLNNGDLLRTRVSKSSGEIGKTMFARILKHQARASKEYFNRVKSAGRHRSNDPAERLR